MNKSHAMLCTLLSALLLSACSTQVDYNKPALDVDEAWHDKTTTEQSSDQKTGAVSAAIWWQQMNDDLLNQLINEATLHNRDVAEALANIEQAKANRRLAAAGFKPTLDLQSSASRNRFSNQSAFGGTRTGIRNSVGGELVASWEPDFFGRNRHAFDAASAQVGAIEATHQGLLLSIIAEVASNYFEVRGFQRQLETTEQDIKLLRSVEDIAKAQNESGMSTRLDLVRAQGERETLQASLPNLKAEISTRIYRISVLTGQPPETHLHRFENHAPVAMPSDRVPVGLRSDILKRRPDIQMAERDLAAATANLGIAKADRFPSFSLTGAVGSSARVFSDLFLVSTLTSSIATAINWSIYSGGALTAQIDIADLEVKAALARYEQSVLLALEDAESALLRYGLEWQTLKQLRIAENSRQQAADIAKLRYQYGEEDLLVVLDAERSLITTRNDIINSETRILAYLSLLYKSLGGGWKVIEDKTELESAK